MLHEVEDLERRKFIRRELAVAKRHEKFFLDQRSQLANYMREVRGMKVIVELFSLEHTEAATNLTNYSYFIEVKVADRGGYLVHQQKVDVEVLSDDSRVNQIVSNSVFGLLELQELDRSTVIYEEFQKFCRGNTLQIWEHFWGRGVNSIFIRDFIQEFIATYEWKPELKLKISALGNTIPSAIKHYFNFEFHRCNVVLDRYYYESAELIKQNRTFSKSEKDRWLKKLPYREVLIANEDQESLRKNFLTLKKKAYRQAFMVCLERLEKEGQFSKPISQFLQVLLDSWV